jgi:hypothetical protein
MKRKSIREYEEQRDQLRAEISRLAAEKYDMGWKRKDEEMASKGYYALRWRNGSGFAIYVKSIKREDEYLVFEQETHSDWYKDVGEFHWSKPNGKIE